MNKTILITGANRGTGYYIAKYYHDMGYKVIALNRTLCGEEWMNEFKCDLSQIDEVQSVFTSLLDQVDRVDVCVLNAGVRRLFSFQDMNPADFLKSINVNYLSNFIIMKSLLPVFKSSGTYLFVVGSHAGEIPFEEGGAYCSTKAALKSLTDVFRLETRSFGIRTTLINSGAINNRPKGNNEYKIQPESLAEVIFNLSTSKHDIMVGELEVRPSKPLKSSHYGMDKLQYV